jgi:hypothetical protein
MSDYANLKNIAEQLQTDERNAPILAALIIADAIKEVGRQYVQAMTQQSAKDKL